MWTNGDRRGSLLKGNEGLDNRSHLCTVTWSCQKLGYHATQNIQIFPEWTEHATETSVSSGDIDHHRSISMQNSHKTE